MFYRLGFTRERSKVRSLVRPPSNQDFNDSNSNSSRSVQEKPGHNAGRTTPASIASADTLSLRLGACAGSVGDRIAISKHASAGP
jgi:hypothetical protein